MKPSNTVDTLRTSSGDTSSSSPSGSKSAPKLKAPLVGSAKPSESSSRKPSDSAPSKSAIDFGAVADYARRYWTHFNAGTAVRAAEAYRERIAAGDAMMITLSGAFSTGEGGKWLAELIRRDKVHAIAATGANVEEDVFNLVGRDEYLALPRYRDLRPKDEEALRKKDINRVTDTGIPDKVMEPVIEALEVEWHRADSKGQSRFFHEYFYEILNAGVLRDLYQVDPDDSWMVAAAAKKLPLIVPGAEDSSSGNAFVSRVLKGELQHFTTIRSGMEYFAYVSAWYGEMAFKRQIGFWQLGGGIAGDMPICCVPMLHLELGRDDLPLWSYFCQIGDSHESYGGYSGAAPSEKQTWLKLEEDTPTFDIKSDYTAIAPIMAAIILADD